MTALDERLAALADATEIAAGRLDEEDVETARAAVAKAGARLGLGVEETVVALAGPTGAGKSSLFNALAGAELTDVGRRRPTTSAAVAAVWGDGGDALLDWLEIPRRHRLEGGRLDGLVLLDLPDFDSVEREHRLEVDRLVDLVDLVVWVVDPQKYADAAWHDDYVRPLADYRESMAVVLNQADLLDPVALAACRQDLERLLAADGAEGVVVLAVSAETGQGLPALQALLVERVAARAAAVARLAADVDVAAGRLATACGGGPAGVQTGDRDRLLRALAEAAGVPTVVRAVEAAHRRRGALATGWPFLRWIRRLRPDPLRRLRLSDEPAENVHTSLPRASEVQVAGVETAARRLAGAAAEGTPEPWPRLVRAAATSELERAPDELDRAVAGADLHVGRPLWWRLAGPLQTAFAAAVAVGLLWLLALLALDYLGLEDAVPTPEARDIPLPTALVLGGVLAGVVVAFLARIVNGFGARRRSRAASRSLTRRIELSARTLVLDPVAAELEAYDRLCTTVEAARATVRTRARPSRGRMGAARGRAGAARGR